MHCPISKENDQSGRKRLKPFKLPREVVYGAGHLLPVSGVGAAILLERHFCYLCVLRP